MMLDLFKQSVTNIAHRKMRNGLTTLSILIGIMAIFALMSFGQGLNKYIVDLGEEQGVDKLMVLAKGTGSPGMDANFRLTVDELDFLRKQNGVEEGIGFFFGSAEVTLGKEVKYTFGISIPSGHKELVESMFVGIEIEKGRAIKEGDDSKVVLGHNYQMSGKIFDKPVELGQKVEINGVKKEVIGFYEEVGNPQDDSQLYFTETTTKNLFDLTDDDLAFIFLQTSPGEDPRRVAESLTKKLRKYRGEEEGKELFYIQTYIELLETFGNVINILNSMLVLIAFVSLLVASVNIANSMYTSVLERTKEIGVMKAIGAKNSTILWLFLLEAGALGLFGGFLGIVVGFLIAKGGGVIAATAGYSFLKPVFPWWLTVGSLTFSFMVGAASGVFPARQASKLKPVDALRYE